jgi:hypothetical protein
MSFMSDDARLVEALTTTVAEIVRTLRPDDAAYQFAVERALERAFRAGVAHTQFEVVLFDDLEDVSPPGAAPPPTPPDASDKALFRESDFRAGLCCGLRLARTVCEATPTGRLCCEAISVELAKH